MKRPKIDWKAIKKLGTDREDEVGRETERLEYEHGWRDPCKKKKK